jgi:hypothetical protein
MAAFLEVVRGQNERKKLEMGGCPAQPQTARQEGSSGNKTRIAMRVQQALGSFAEFEFEKIMKRTHASTRVRLYPPRCAVKTSPPVYVELLIYRTIRVKEQNRE